jgi:plasmid stabilization system protein ParE
MKFKIETTKIADKSYLQILQFLIENYGTRVAQKFEVSVKKCVDLICLNPELFEYDREYQCRKGVIDSYTSMFYEVKSFVIIIHLFWHNRQNPKDIHIQI